MMNVICPLDWRYGSEEMRGLFLTEAIIKRFIVVEKAIMKGLEEMGYAKKGCSEVIDECAQSITASDVYTRESVMGHDIAALTYLLGEKCGECGKYVHLGATSYDVVDTAWALIIKDALAIVKRRLRYIIEKLIDMAYQYKEAIMVGRTHGQHALPITLGFKFANYIYEFTRSLERLFETEKRVVRSKISGAVGTMAAWRGKGIVLEEIASKYLGLEPHKIATQVAPRDGFAELVSVLAILASQLDRFALEVRELARPEIGEIYETGKRVGSSTMPQKRNPVTAERISGLAKVARSLVIVALENIPLMHERDLTNSSSERILIPHMFLIIDQMLIDMLKLLDTIYIDIDAMKRNLDLLKGQIMSEAIMIKLVEKGMPRHEAHKILSEITRNLKAEESLKQALIKDERILKLLTIKEIEEALNYYTYLGNYKELIDRTIKYSKDVLNRIQ